MNEKPKLHVVSFSGGKDSTAMLLRMIEENYPIDEIVCVDTGLEFPEMYDHIDKVEEYIGRPITRLKAENDFMYYATEKEICAKSDKIPGIKPGDIIKGWRYPTLKSRWCTKHLKIEVVDKYFKHLKKDYEVVRYLGIAFDEPHREREHNYPLIDWKMTEADCLKYCYDRGFDWSGLYEIWDRVSCWCCPLQSLEDLRKLRKLRPELWSELKEMDDRIQEVTVDTPEDKRKNFQFNKSLTDIERRFEVEEEYIAQGKKLRTREFFQDLKDRGIKY